jgi:hypothetical protein|tara:strand:- start:10368 stop:10715 length:348 start_codon:yes stop_codon:yes gene_type:complete
MEPEMISHSSGLALVVTRVGCRNCGEIHEAPQGLFAIATIDKGKILKETEFLPSYPRDIVYVNREPVRSCHKCFIPTEDDTQLFLFPEELKPPPIVKIDEKPKADVEAFSLEDFM